MLHKAINLRHAQAQRESGVRTQQSIIRGHNEVGILMLTPSPALQFLLCLKKKKQEAGHTERYKQ